MGSNRLFNNIENNQCNIYYLYETYSVINKEQRTVLDENETKMGKLYDMASDIEIRDYFDNNLINNKIKIDINNNNDNNIIEYNDDMIENNNQ